MKTEESEKLNLQVSQVFECIRVQYSTNKMETVKSASRMVQNIQKWLFRKFLPFGRKFSVFGFFFQDLVAYTMPRKNLI